MKPLPQGEPDVYGIIEKDLFLPLFHTILDIIKTTNTKGILRSAFKEVEIRATFPETRDLLQLFIWLICAGLHPDVCDSILETELIKITHRTDFEFHKKVELHLARTFLRMINNLQGTCLDAIFQLMNIHCSGQTKVSEFLEPQQELYEIFKRHDAERKVGNPMV